MNKMYRILILLMLIVSSLFVLNACKKPAAIPGSGDGNKQEEHVHSFGNPVVIEADCTKPGSETRSCECGKIDTTTIPPLGHEAGETVVVAQRDPTCQLEGYLETEIRCSRCGYGFDSEIIEYEKIADSVTIKSLHDGYTENHLTKKDFLVGATLLNTELKDMNFEKTVLIKLQNWGLKTAADLLELEIGIKGETAIAIKNALYDLLKK